MNNGKKSGVDFTLLAHRSSFIITLALIALCGCQANSHIIEPKIVYTPQKHVISTLPSAFEPLSPEERNQDWGRELIIARTFASELDLYRAITSYKRALILLPPGCNARRLEIEYGIILSYYLGRKYSEVIETFETSTEKNIPSTFPVFDDLLAILYDSYQHVGQHAKACQILTMIEARHPTKAYALQMSEAISKGDITLINELAAKDPSYEDVYFFLNSYHKEAKSVRKAQTLNAILPGAGYYYVGQKKTALTSFLINTLFIAAAYQFFHNGYVAAGVITTSLEAGWYFGGINGAGLAAKEYNERLYENSAKEYLSRNCLFPVLMLQKTF